MSDLRLDPTNLIGALMAVERVTGRLCSDSLNRAGKHIIIGSGSGPGAMQLTPKAERSKIQALSNRVLAGYVIKKLRSAGRWPAPRAELNRLIRKERSRRLSAIGYLAYVGWNNAARAFGARGVGRKIGPGFVRSEASGGYGRKATVNRLEAVLVNMAPAGERLGDQALQDSVDNAADDLLIYATRRLNDAIRRYDLL